MLQQRVHQYFGAGLPCGLAGRPGGLPLPMLSDSMRPGAPGLAFAHVTMGRVTSVLPGGPAAGEPRSDGQITDEQALITLASRLGAGSVAGWSGAEQDLVARAGDHGPGSIREVTAARDRIRAGEDLLGDAFCALRSPAGRRGSGRRSPRCRSSRA